MVAKVRFRPARRRAVPGQFRLDPQLLQRLGLGTGVLVRVLNRELAEFLAGGLTPAVVMAGALVEVAAVAAVAPGREVVLWQGGR